MNENELEQRWQQFHKRRDELLIKGLESGSITPYSEEDIAHFRQKTYGGLPISIIILSDGLCNGFCYDRALLLAKALLDMDDIRLLYADTNTFRLNPLYANNPTYWRHCILERTRKDGRKLIYDTAYGLIFEKEIYWEIERPQISHVRTKQEIAEFLEEENRIHPENAEENKWLNLMTIGLLEKTFDSPDEIYASKGVELLQREISLYKESIHYDDFSRQVESDIADSTMGEKRFFLQCLDQDKKPNC